MDADQLGDALLDLVRRVLLHVQQVHPRVHRAPVLLQDQPVIAPSYSQTPIIIVTFK
jgi:hypothetical protein